jgi:hypothetical protein
MTKIFTAAEAAQIFLDRKLRQIEKLGKARDERFSSGIYDMVFHLIMQESAEGKESAHFSPSNQLPHFFAFRKFLKADLDSLGYRVSELRMDEYIEFIISWGIAISELNEKQNKS